MSSVKSAAESVRLAVGEACRGLVQRETLVELVVLCAVAREHLLVVGPPGTAKSEAVRRIARRLGGRYFEYLVGRFTEPTEIFGPVNLRKLKEGIVETETVGMLPDAEIAFLDEVFAVRVRASGIDPIWWTPFEESKGVPWKKKRSPSDRSAALVTSSRPVRFSLC